MTHPRKGRFVLMDEWLLLRRSHALMRRLEAPAAAGAVEELMFLEFRPAWLTRQRRVYDALGRETCQICMYDYYVEARAKQHEPRHPTICVACFAKLNRCPFCRVPLDRRVIPMLSLLDAWPSVRLSPRLD